MCCYVLLCVPDEIVNSFRKYLFYLTKFTIDAINNGNYDLLKETISKNIRKQMYEHIQNLSYSYHNNVDTGDLIQRCTSDIETIKTFISAQLPEILYI